MISLTGLREIADRYDGFVIDLWGVIHDGVRPYPGAVECLERLRGLGKGVVLLSNAPRRAAVSMAALRALGIADRLYDAIETSGEATWRALRDRPDGWYAGLGERVYHLGPERDLSVMEGLGLSLVATPAEASFVLNTGPDDARSPTDAAAFDDVLAACRAAGLPMLCANPDLSVVRGGVEIVCAGALALRYEALGGMVRRIGKPDAGIYQGVLARLGMARARVLAIGDSLRTDIAGAAAAGLDSVWVLGGVRDGAAEPLGLAPVGMIREMVW